MEKQAIVIVIIFSVLLLFCIGILYTVGDKNADKTPQHNTVNYSIECIDGVEYFTGWGRSSKFIFSPHFKPDGSLYLCK